VAQHFESVDDYITFPPDVQNSASNGAQHDPYSGSGRERVDQSISYQIPRFASVARVAGGCRAPTR
jgi:hypothetical protein